MCKEVDIIKVKVYAERIQFFKSHDKSTQRRLGYLNDILLLEQEIKNINASLRGK